MARPSPLSRPGPLLQSGLGPPLGADVITYDPTDSGLTADDLQEAIDELAALITAGGSGMVPYFIDTGETFTVPVYKQALFAMTIDVLGTLAVDGYLIEVD